MFVKSVMKVMCEVFAYMWNVCVWCHEFLFGCCSDEHWGDVRFVCLMPAR